MTAAIRACPGPDSNPHGPTRFVVPPGAVDAHAHVIGTPPDYPRVAERSYDAPAATAAQYLDMLDRTGMECGVLVQVSIHGTDNRLMVETLSAHPDRLRGVAVTGLRTPGRELAALKDAGVTGLRLNMLFGGGIGTENLEGFGDLCREMGWHIQLLVDPGMLPALRPRIARLPVPVVIDHMAHLSTRVGLGSEGFQALLGTLRDGAWVKLSGAYRMTGQGVPYADTVPYARAVVEAAPGRCVWGSDWPHVAHWGPMMNVGDLLDTLADWVPDEAARHAVLVGNPRRLYGFPPAGAPS